MDPVSGVRIDVVDNGGQWTHREWRVLRYIGAETNIIPNTTPLEDIVADGIVLSGGAARVNLQSGKLGNIGDYLHNGQIPVLAICLGLHYMTLYYDGEVGQAEFPEFGRTEIEVLEEDILLRGIPKNFIAWESHNDEVKVLPPRFRAIARSEHCSVQAVVRDSKPWFCTQFHPEVEQTEHGYEIFKNYMAFVEEYKRS